MLFWPKNVFFCRRNDQMPLRDSLRERISQLEIRDYVQIFTLDEMASVGDHQISDQISRLRGREGFQLPGEADGKHIDRLSWLKDRGY